MLPLRADAAGWWEPLAFAGRDVTAVSSTPSVLAVIVDGRLAVSFSGGPFQMLLPGTPMSSVAPVIQPPVSAGGTTWSIVDGRVRMGAGSGGLQPDPDAPYLGAGARYLAAPGAVPGLVLAVGTDGHVWRRLPDGTWTTSLVLLPAGGFSGPPQVTGLQAFTQPLTPAVYLATDGEGVLLTDDGGADWIRTDGTGLPDTVNGIAASNSAKSLYAATSDGLWVHQLQAFPQPPTYADAQLWWRWLGIAVIAAASVAAAAVALRRLLPAPS